MRHVRPWRYWRRYWGPRGWRPTLRLRRDGFPHRCRVCLAVSSGKSHYGFNPYLQFAKSTGCLEGVPSAKCGMYGYSKEGAAFYAALDKTE